MQRISPDKTNGKANGGFHGILRLLYSLSLFGILPDIGTCKTFQFSNPSPEQAGLDGKLKFL
jgi:hypothetical protein